MNRFVLVLTVFFMSMVSQSCDSDESVEICFIGDSNIARWDLQKYFPGRNMVNYGVSGAGIEYLEKSAGLFCGQTVVVLIGTNDYALIKKNVIEYSRRYICAINGIGAAKIYLYSVLPCEFPGEDSDVKATIQEFNNTIKTILQNRSDLVYLDVYDEFINGAELQKQYFSDGIHLSGYGYEVLSSYLLSVL